MKEMCAECGADLRVDEVQIHDAAVVPMVHSVPDLKVNGRLILTFFVLITDNVFKGHRIS